MALGFSSHRGEGLMFTHPMPARFKPRRSRAPPMSRTATSSGWVTVLAVSVPVDMSNAHLLTELAERLPRNPLLRLILKLTKVTFFGGDRPTHCCTLGRRPPPTRYIWSCATRPGSP